MRPIRISLVLMLVLTLSCCSAYIRIADTNPPADSDHGSTQQVGRRFNWVINWLNERGPVGQVIANLVIALFVLPPLGPIVCSFLENCDETRATARSLVSARSTGAFEDSNILEMLDTAYEKYI